jgi:hypothetical protein
MYLIHPLNYTSPRLLAILLQNNSNFHVYQYWPGSRAERPIPSSAPRGGVGWGPPLCIGIQAVGTYIYSRTYMHGALGTLLRSFTAANMVGEPVDPFRWLKKPPALPFAAFHHPPWDYGIVFAYGPTPP